MLTIGTNYMTAVTGRLLHCSHNCIRATIYTYRHTTLPYKKNNKEVKYHNLSTWQLKDNKQVKHIKSSKSKLHVWKNINAQ